jgi:hypothetical protein
VNIVDDDSTVPGIQITQTNGGTEVTEAGTEDTYTMVLTSRPNAYVRIKVLSNNWEATTSGALFTFLPHKLERAADAACRCEVIPTATEPRQAFSST